MVRKITGKPIKWTMYMYFCMCICVCPDTHTYILLEVVISIKFMFDINTHVELVGLCGIIKSGRTFLQRKGFDNL